MKVFKKQTDNITYLAIVGDQNESRFRVVPDLTGETLKLKIFDTESKAKALTFGKIPLNNETVVMLSPPIYEEGVGGIIIISVAEGLDFQNVIHEFQLEPITEVQDEKAKVTI